jgi:Tfp pilus assembly protein PilE
MLWHNTVRRRNQSVHLLMDGPKATGLSYVEVMVSMLISALFLSTTLQAYVAATGLKAKSQQINTAIAAIQADVETIRHMAQGVPKTSAECQLPSSGSYVEQVISNIGINDAATFNNAAQNQSSPALIGPIEPTQDPFIFAQTSTLPIEKLPDDYRLRRVLSLDKREGPPVQVLQISYQVLRQSASSESTELQPQKNADQPQIHSIQTETLLAQLHTSILPNAALVCF